MNWKKLNEKYLEENPNSLNKKYYEPLVTKFNDYIRIEATQVEMCGISSHYPVFRNIWFRDKSHQDLYKIEHPNWWEKLLGITFEDKIQYAKKKVREYCDRKNKKIFQMSKVNV